MKYRTHQCGENLESSLIPWRPGYGTVKYHLACPSLKDEAMTPLGENKEQEGLTWSYLSGPTMKGSRQC